MTLSQRIYSMILPSLTTLGGIHTHPITKQQYVKVKLNRTANYIKFRNFWNTVLNGRIINLPFDSRYKLKLGALSKNTNDELTIYLLDF